jgi:AcrR family transcriptional regulator
LKKQAKQLRSRETILTILNAAAQVVIAEGYERSTTIRVAERAGYSVGTLYQYFDDKEDIFNELYERAFAELVAITGDCSVKPTLAETLREVIVRNHRALTSYPELFEALEILSTGPFKAKRDRAREDIAVSMAQLLDAHRNEVVVEDLQLAARVLIGATEGICSAVSPRVFNSPEIEEQILRLQLAYLTMEMAT